MKTLAILAIVIAAVDARPADACTCRPPSVEVSPTGTGVPIDATVMIWVPERFSSAGKPKFALRPAGKARVDFTSKVTGSGQTEVFELVPKQPLAADTTYEVVVEQGGKQTVAQTFTTGSSRSTQAPAWKAQGIGRIRNVTRETWGGGSCMNRGPDLEVIWMTKDKAPERLRVGIWIGTTIDLTQPPTTYVNGLRTLQFLGHPTYCTSAMLAIPKDPKLKFVAKLFDVAGNASEAREYVLDTTRSVPLEGF